MSELTEPSWAEGNNRIISASCEVMLDSPHWNNGVSSKTFDVLMSSILDHFSAGCGESYLLSVNVSQGFRL